MMKKDVLLKKEESLKEKLARFKREAKPLDMDLRTSSGVQFRPRLKIEEKSRVVSREEAEFRHTCFAYGLTPDFFDSLLIQDLANPEGEQFFLRGFEGDQANVVSENGIGSQWKIEYALRSLKNALKSEQEDLEYRIKKYYDPSVVEYKKSVKDARRELRQRQRDVDEAFDVYTLNMDKVYLQMCVPERQIVSCLGLYEFVGYRPDKDAECPYVLDEISPTHETRHKFVSFDELKDGIEKYKDYNGVTDEERAEIDEVLRTICPMPIIASVKVTVSKKGKKRDKKKGDGCQSTFF